MLDELMDILAGSDLEQFYPNLTKYGVSTLQDLSKLTMQDCERIGVTSTEDRRAMIRMISSLKNRFNKVSTIQATPRSARNNIGFSRSAAQNTSSPKLQQQRTQEDYNQNSAIKNKTRNTANKGFSLDAYGLPIKEKGTSQIVSRLSVELSEKIRVCVRKRPLNKRERARKDTDIVDINNRRTLTLHEEKVKVDLTGYTDSHKFIFDETFDADATNEQVYKRTAKPLVQHVFEGGNATCFAYGQTGSGKTYTMLDELTGLYVLAAEDIFQLVKNPEYRKLGVFVTFYEIYQGHLYDLLCSRKKLMARENEKQQIIIQNLRKVEIANVNQLLEVYEVGKTSRTTGTTGANADSSRSHAVLELSLRNRKNPETYHGRFTFIDLAGSERGADRGIVDSKTRMEGAEINKSLLALKECIRALDQSKSHLPFRQSKLTLVLKDSFVGEARTCMIATIAPNSKNCEHTLNTLRYADRVKELRKETINDLPYEEEIEDSMEGDYIEEDEIQEDDEIQERDEEEYEDTMDDGIENEGISQMNTSFDFNNPPLASKAVIDLPRRLNLPKEDLLNFTGYKGGFSNQIIERILSGERSQIQECTKLTRMEAELLGNLNKELSSLSTTKNSAEQRDKIFKNHLLRLDAYLERKLLIVEDLKDYISKYLP